jgi:hypothetical protein
MTDFCGAMVEKLGSSWPIIGWGLFACWFLGPFFFASTLVQQYAVMSVFGGLLLLWWLVDVVDQQAAIWQILVGLVMVAIGFLPRGSVLSIAAWVIYWTRVRE